MSRFAVVILIAFVWALVAAPTQAQDDVPRLTLTARAGFNTLYRADMWLPVTVEVSSSGGVFTGRLVIRPETTLGLLHPVSTPVTLSDGARQTITLYALLRGGTITLRPELITASGEVAADVDAPVRAISSLDSLVGVISSTPLDAIDLTASADSGTLHQAALSLRDLPDQPALLDALDVLVLADADTRALTPAQQRAIGLWVASGGHLIVTGGANAALTLGGLGDLAPLRPRSSVTLDTLAPLAAWLRGGAADASLNAPAVIVTGEAHPQARVLAAAGDVPLLLRRAYGDGTIDLLTADPNSAPLRGWAGSAALWTALLSSRAPLPGWGAGITSIEDASRAAAVIPGFDPLPDGTPLLVFLVVYILLIAPVNYLVLSRLKRREWAWFTIPALIAVFSIAAYNFGVNLRGVTVTTTRLAVVRAWDGVDQARADAVIGVLSPVRAAYTLAVDDGTLRPIPAPAFANTGFFGRDLTTGIGIVQRDGFSAEAFTVDSSFIARFASTTALPAPAITGRLTLSDGGMQTGGQMARGFVRNDSPLTLTEPVILMRGAIFRPGSPIQPGETLDFELELPGTSPPAPGRRVGIPAGAFFSTRRPPTTSDNSISAILSGGGFDGNLNRRLLTQINADAQELQRRLWLLDGVIDEPFAADSARGDRAFLAAWSDGSPIGLTLDGAGWTSSDRTLYLVALETRFAPSDGEQVIAPDRFTWSRVGASVTPSGRNYSPDSLTVSPGEEVVLRFTPFADARLDEVNRLTISVRTANIGGRNFPMALWDWRAGAWQTVQMVNGTAEITFSPARFVGANGAVLTRFSADDRTGSLRLERIELTMRGTRSSPS
jgi:hypothetical protein